MPVKIRLRRLGRTHRAFYRIAVMDSRVARNGKPIEELGHYDPVEKDEEKSVKVDADKAQDWINKGAQPTDTVADILRKAGVNVPEKKKSKKPTSKKTKAEIKAEKKKKK